MEHEEKKKNLGAREGKEEINPDRESEREKKRRKEGEDDRRRGREEERKGPRPLASRRQLLSS